MKSATKEAHTPTVKTLHDLKWHAANAAKHNQYKAIHKAAKPITDEVVSEAPKGTVHKMSRNSIAFDNLLGIMVYEDKGLITHMIEGEDGKVWFDNPFTYLYTCSYFYGEREGDKITIPGGQLVIQEYDEEEDEMINGYLCAALPDYTEEYDWCLTTEENTFTLELVDGVWKSTDPDLVLGLCFYTDASELEYYKSEEEDNARGSVKAPAAGTDMIMLWTGYGDFSIEYSEQTDTPMEAPKGLETEKWAFILQDGGYSVNVAKDDNNIYIQGIYSYIPEGWIKLSINGNKASMKSGQYLGEDTEHYNHYGYAFGGTWERDEDRQMMVSKALDELVFDYDAEAKSLRTNGTLFISGVGNTMHAIDYLNAPYMKRQERTLGTRPATPRFESYLPFDMEYNNCAIDFVVPNEDVEGNTLDSKRLYYNIFVDGELYTAYPEDGYQFTEEMTDFPWEFTNEWDIYKNGSHFSFYIFLADLETIGVQSHYVDDDDTLLHSDIMTYDILNKEVMGIENVGVDGKEVKATEYYDLQGRQVKNPGTGLYIERTIYTDGSAKANKIRK